MLVTIPSTLEILRGDNGDPIEIDVTIEAYVTPYDPGITSGPAEVCYPPEGGIEDPTIIVNGARATDTESLAAIIAGDYQGAFIYTLDGDFNRLIDCHADELYDAILPPDYY